MNDIAKGIEEGLRVIFWICKDKINEGITKRGAVFSKIIPKKVELLIQFFEPFWILRVFHFSLRTFEKVEPHPGPLEPSDETYTQSKFDISGSNETMQNALASIV